METFIFKQKFDLDPSWNNKHLDLEGGGALLAPPRRRSPPYGDACVGSCRTVSMPLPAAPTARGARKRQANISSMNLILLQFLLGDTTPDLCDR
jgi:hypothetical protein